jgi:branched-chain amino acid transport system ATP-binding protein
VDKGAQTVLAVKDISKSFGGVRAVDSFSMDLKKGEVVGLIGPNGAGKTTVLNMISKVTAPDSGDIIMGNASLVGLPPYRVADLGISRTFQEIHLFRGLSVLSNVKAACHLRACYSVAEGLLRTGRAPRIEAEVEEACMDTLRMFGLEGEAHVEAQSLPYGRQKLLEIVKALVTRPSILLLDEPAAGLNSEETHELKDLVETAREKFDLSIIVIEHTMEFISDISDRVVVMNFGRKLAEGTWDEIRCNDEVLKCYLGED